MDDDDPVASELDEDCIPPTIENDDDSANSDIEKQSGYLCAWLIAFIINLKSIHTLTDTALECILKFFYIFLSLLGKFAPICASIARKFPKSAHYLYKYHVVKTLFQKLVVCGKCHSTYHLKDCIEGHGTNQRAKSCSYIEFINHPQMRMRKPCGFQLLKVVEFIDKRKIFYPYLTYCYLGLKVSLETIIARPGFSEMIETNFKTNMVPKEKMSDVYQGKVWSEFQQYNNEPLLSYPFSLGLMMNFDFFQPYKHVAYSIGVIYLVIMNLPRNVRFKRENVILIGIIPGPHEPSKDINSYLNPLVDELLTFFEGVDMNVHGSAMKRKIRCVLLCVSCDIPAGRKVCGFLGHGAHSGCSKCLKQFSGSVGSMDYSGFNRESWTVRTVAAHKAAVSRIMKCYTKTSRQKIESETGFRNTALLKLPYFDSCRMLLVDPMHNLYLGSAKHILKAVWIEKNMLTPSNFERIQSRVDKCVVPTDIGRIPHKILSGFASFTADQFKNWVVYFSLIALRGLLCDEHLECWRHFVLACRLLSQHQLSKDNVIVADALLLKFCRRMESLYGESVVTPNMHLHCHLKECILDFGPLHGFWCFPFERYNGVLGNVPNNNRSIEAQMMNRFVTDNTLMSMPLPDTFTELRQHIPQGNKVVGSLLEGSDHQNFSSSQVVLPKCFTRGFFVSEEVEELKKIYSKLHPDSNIEVYSSFKKYLSIIMHGKQLGSYKSRSSHSSIVMVNCSNVFINPGVLLANELRPARINYFASVSIKINSEDQPTVIASVSWFQQHPLKNSCGKPLTVWESNTFETNICTLIPIQFIGSRTVSIIDTVGYSNGLIVCPCIDF